MGESPFAIFGWHAVAGYVRQEQLYQGSIALPPTLKRQVMPSIEMFRAAHALLPSATVLFVLAGCASGRMGATKGAERAFDHAAQYRVSCSPRSECRIRYMDEDGSLREETALGEWTREVGADTGARLWLQVAGGGCPASTITASIWVDGEPRAQRTDSPSPNIRCQWLTAVAAYEVPR